MRNALTRLIRRLRGAPAKARREPQSRGGRLLLRVPRRLLAEIRAATVPSPARGEPLVLLRARYVSEETRDVLVGIGAVPFPDAAYVDGPAGANFDTDWLMDAANREIARDNVGLLLVHSHGGRGRPRFSPVDARTNSAVIAPLAIGAGTAPYGAIVLSDDDATATVVVGRLLVDVAVVPIADGRAGGSER